MTSPDASPILLFDTLSSEKKPLQLLQPGQCGIYCCGPTVYDVSHIGHARAALAPDLLVRFLRHRGLQVKYVRNITDVDDKIIARAQREGVEASAISEFYTQSYREALRELGMLTPDVEPKVTEHVDEVIEIISVLIERKVAYPVDGDVYFRVRAFPSYGKLSKRQLDDMQAGARVDVDERKEDPQDFALWKAAKPGEPAWQSPWGPGRPGWHIECSAMSCKHLGKSFDVHTGGRDLIFPHHENEIAQSQAAYGVDTFATTWIHNGFVNYAGEKMSKSLGNFFTISEVTQLYHPEVLRFFLMSVHYRSPVNFEVNVHCPGCKAVLNEAEQQALACTACKRTATHEELRRSVRFPGLEEADERVAYIYETIEAAQLFAKQNASVGTKVAPIVAATLAKIEAALFDDLNTAAALAELSEPLAEVNRLLTAKKGIDVELRSGTVLAFVELMRQAAALLGSFGRDPAAYLLARRDLKAARIGLDRERVEAAMKARTDARATKDWARADEARAELDALGVRIRDGQGTSTWTL
jgi:cysteinyl-tRNA synthetase